MSNESGRKWRLANPERVKENSRRGYARCSKELLMWRDAKNRAKAGGFPFLITVGDIVIPTYCPALGFKLEVGVGRPHECSPTLDRVIPHLGYVKGNIDVISFRANRLKSDGTSVEHQQIADYIEKGNLRGNAIQGSRRSE